MVFMCVSVYVLKFVVNLQQPEALMIINLWQYNKTKNNRTVLGIHYSESLMQLYLDSCINICIVFLLICIPYVCLQDEETPLQVASSRGHLDCVENLVENGAAIDVQDQTGQTSLHLALRRKHKDIALYLINKGCGLNICDNVSGTFKSWFQSFTFSLHGFRMGTLHCTSPLSLTCQLLCKLCVKQAPT